MALICLDCGNIFPECECKTIEAVTTGEIQGSWRGFRYTIPKDIKVTVEDQREGYVWLHWEDEVVPVMPNCVTILNS